jgi:hypothetical protein
MGEESPKPASTPTGAVFLSYASHDAASPLAACLFQSLTGSFGNGTIDDARR